MSWAEDFPHIPIWLRCTYRHIIDPNVKGSIYGGIKAWDERKFTPAQVRLIRAEEGTIESVAKTWNASYSTIHAILRRETYKDVE